MSENSELYRALTETQRSITELARSTSALETHVPIILHRLDGLSKLLTENNERATAARDAMADRIDGIDRRLDEIDNTIAHFSPVAQTVERMEKDAWKRAGVFGGLGIVIGGAFFALKDRIFNWIGL